MLIDDVTIEVKAGDGGRGAVAFNTTKMNLGPAGADGGNGGSVYFEGVSDIFALRVSGDSMTGENISDGLSQLVHGGDRIVLRYE